MRYIHTILSAALSAVTKSGRFARNQAAKAHPPTARQAKAPEMDPWTASSSARSSAGLLALCWRDVDLDAGTVRVRRSVGVVRVLGEGSEVIEGDTKTGKPRVVDLGDATVTELRHHKRDRGGLALQLVRDDALIFGDHEGRHLHPERFSRTFAAELVRCGPPLAHLMLCSERLRHDAQPGNIRALKWQVRG